MKIESCVIALDFGKAFDSVNRNYLYNSIKVIRTPANMVKCIKAIYEKTTAVVEVNHHMTKSVEIKRGSGRDARSQHYYSFLPFNHCCLTLKTTLL